MADEELEPRERVRAGARVGVGLAAAFALALTFGATARQEGWGTLLPIVCSIVVFSGSAQFALVTALSGGGGLLPAVESAAPVNARFPADGGGGGTGPAGRAAAPGAVRGWRCSSSGRSTPSPPSSASSSSARVG